MMMVGMVCICDSKLKSVTNGVFQEDLLVIDVLMMLLLSMTDS
jgi:hypothetical protein